jgi:hypothetical protein
MKIRYILVVFLGITLALEIHGQKLTPLFEIKESYRKDEFRIIPKYQLMVGNNLTLYHKEKLIFLPTNEEDFYIFELFKKKYVVITPIKSKESSAIYMFAKNEILLYSLEHGVLYDTNIKCKRIIKVLEDRKVIVVADYGSIKRESIQLTVSSNNRKD